MNAIGFDPFLVRRLQRALLDTLDDLDRLTRLAHRVDTAAVCRPALDEARRVIADRWVPATARVLACAALDGSVWSGPHGWVIGTPAAGRTAGPTVDEQARHLAHRWLDAQSRWQGGVDTRREVRAVSDEIATLARTVRPDIADTLLDRLPPVVGALLLPHLDLGDSHLARLAVRLQERETAAHFDPDDDTIGSWGATRPNTSDLVANLLAGRPLAAQRWAVVAVRHPTLLGSAFDTGAEQRALRAATTPGTGTAAVAGEILAALIARHVRLPLRLDTDTSGAPWDRFLAELAAPWFPELVTGSGRFTWLDAEIDHRAAVRHLLWDSDSGDTLRGAERDVVLSAVRQLADAHGALDLIAVQRLADITVTFADAQRDVAVEAGRIERLHAELLSGAAEYLLTKGAAAIPVAGPSIAAAVGPAAAIARQWAGSEGWYPPDADTVERTTDEALGDRLADLQALVVMAAATSLIHRGDLPARFLTDLPRPAQGCRADQVDRSLRQHVQSFARTHPRAVTELTAVLGTFANRATAVALCP